MNGNFAAFDRLKTLLQDAGMDEESLNFIIGKYTHAATDKVMAEIVSVGGEEALKQIIDGDQQEALSKLEATFKEKKGKSIAEYREEVAEDMVKEFEAAA
ncbi:MAG: hypothetical protein QG639_363 [Patescibacteria group bacterium]|nr:hypothetical protein [Patescibacteria group bacterium]